MKTKSLYALIALYSPVNQKLVQMDQPFPLAGEKVRGQDLQFRLSFLSMSEF